MKRLKSKNSARQSFLKQGGYVFGCSTRRQVCDTNELYEKYYELVRTRSQRRNASNTEAPILDLLSLQEPRIYPCSYA